MKRVRICVFCGGTDIKYIADRESWYCNKCQKDVEIAEKFVENPFERMRSAVYATGNKWAIENWEATHN